jgi:hypothetical protein
LRLLEEAGSFFLPLQSVMVTFDIDSVAPILFTDYRRTDKGVIGVVNISTHVYDDSGDVDLATSLQSKCHECRRDLRQTRYNGDDRNSTE